MGERSDLRQFARHSAVAGATLVFSRTNEQQACIVREASEAGARLLVENHDNIPEEFVLICQALGIEAHCERVWVHQGEVGVRFTSRGVLTEAAGAGQASTAEATTKSSEAAELRPLCSVLVAEDDVFFLEMARFTLVEDGFRVVTAEDGEIAAAAIAEARFDLIIADVQMPELDGLDVVRLARAGGPNTSTPIVIMTGNDDPATMLAAYRAGATSFLAKPIDWPTFAESVRVVLRGHQEIAEKQADLAIMRRWLSQDADAPSS